jgi:DNA-binding PadR family transcriptional regulator
MDIDEIVSGFLLELRRGTINLSVLSKLRTSTYGYNLIGKLSECGISIEANTLYPMLRRLESQGLLESRWDTEGKKPRKYYQTSPKGIEVLGILRVQWKITVENLNNILEVPYGEERDN